MVNVHKKHNLAEFSLLLMNCAYSLDKLCLLSKRYSLRGKKSKPTYLMVLSIAGNSLNTKIYCEFVVPLSNGTTNSQYLGIKLL